MLYLNYITFTVVTFYFIFSLYKEPAKPTAYIVYFFSLYFFSSVIGDRTLIFELKFEVYWYVYFLSVVTALFIGQYLSKKIKLTISYNPSLSVLSKSIWLYLFFLFPFVSYMILGLIKYFVSGRGSYGESWEVVRSLVVFGNPIISFSFGLILLYYLKRNHMYLLFLAPLLILSFLLGERGDIVNIVLCLVPVYFISKRKVIWFPFALMFAIATAGVYGNARAQLEYGAVHFIESVYSSIVSNPILILAPLDVNEFVNVSTPSKAAMEDGLILPDRGMNLLKGPIKTTPYLGRFFAQDHASSGELIRDNYYQELADAGVATGSGALLILGFDLYLFGGIIAVFIGMLLFSFYINRLYVLSRCKGSRFIELLYVLSFPLFVMQVQRSSFESVFIYLFKQNYLVVFFIILISLLSMVSRGKS